MSGKLLKKRSISPQENATDLHQNNKTLFHNGKPGVASPTPSTNSLKEADEEISAVVERSSSRSEYVADEVKSGALIEQMFRARSSLDDIEKNYSVEIKDLNAEINSVHNKEFVVSSANNHKLAVKKLSQHTKGTKNKKKKAAQRNAHDAAAGGDVNTGGDDCGEEKFGLKYALSLFKTVPFPSPKIEELYRRYFFHLNQHFINWFLVILILVCLCEIGLHFHFNQIGSFR